MLLSGIVAVGVQTMVKVISLGGSIIAPDSVDIEFIRSFKAVVSEYLEGDPGRRLILITGGGAPARAYQKAYRDVMPAHGRSGDAQDWIGIAATRLNGELMRGVFGECCTDAVVTDPSAEFPFTGRVLVAAGWKPGFSSDFDAVMLAERFSAGTVVNLSNIAKVYTADPRLVPQAVPLDRISWNEFRKIVGDEWVPGKNAPFDPIATARAAELGLTVIVAAGHALSNLRNILLDLPFDGTVIGPD